MGSPVTGRKWSCADDAGAFRPKPCLQLSEHVLSGLVKGKGSNVTQRNGTVMPAAFQTKILSAQLSSATLAWQPLSDAAAAKLTPSRPHTTLLVSSRSGGAVEMLHGHERRTWLPSCSVMRSHSAAVRVSSHTIALYSGWPVRRSHTSVVSRWLVMPTAATWPEIEAVHRCPQSVSATPLSNLAW